MLTHIEPVKGWHVAELAPKLRQEDKDEIWAMEATDPFTGLAHSVALSHVSYSIMEGASPVAIYGARKLTDDLGLVWLLASSDLPRHPIQFLRRSREYIDALHDEVGCRTLYNFTDKRNTLHHKWLSWTGFTFGDEVQLGPFNMPFYEVSRTKG